MVFASTVASAGCGSRMATSPDTVVSRMSVGFPLGFRSSTMFPLIDSARTEAPAPSTTVRSPETVWKRSSPVTAWASTLPETVSARTGPASPTSVESPLTPRTSVRPRIPDTTAPAPTTPTSTADPAGTASETTALRCQPLRSNHLRKPFQGRPSYATVRVPPSWVTISGGPSIAETSSRAVGSSVPTTLTAPPTMRTLSDVTGSSKVSFRGSAMAHVDTGMDLTSRGARNDTTYRVSCRTRYIADL